MKKEKLYSDINANIIDIKNKIAEAAVAAGRDPEEIRLMAVTKTVEPQLVNFAMENGVTLLGESRAQELAGKIDDYDQPESREIHFIGALQTNKVRQIIDCVDMIESVDRISLAKEIEKRAKQKDLVMDILIQVNIGQEESKSGIAVDELDGFVTQIEGYSHLRLRGLMAIPPICEDKEELNGYFMRMRQLLVDIQTKKIDNRNVNILSMGMSGDFESAVAHGATIIRIGSALFGQRP